MLMMKNLKKMIMATMMVATLTLGMSIVSFAATGWQNNDIGWWYSTSEDESSWYASCWQWLDGNADGIAECYCFDGNGYIYVDTITPDGYTVNPDGAWTVDGVVQTINVSVDGGSGSGSGSSTSTGNSGSGSSSNGETVAMTKDEIIAQGYNEYGISNVAMDMINNTREENAKYGEVDSYEGLSDFDTCISVEYANGYKVDYYVNTANGKAYHVRATDPALIIKDADESIAEDSSERKDLLKELGLSHVLDDGISTIANFNDLVIRWYKPSASGYDVILSRG